MKRRAKRILIVDDEPYILEDTGHRLEVEGYEVLTASSGEEAVALAEAAARSESEKLNLIITDLKMEGLGWEELVESLVALLPETPVIVLTAQGDLERNLNLVKRGAFDVVDKLYHPKDFLFRIARALDHNEAKVAVRERERELRDLRLRLEAEEQNLIASDEVSRKLLDQIRTVAATDFPVTLMGESGTGKEMVAQYVHRQSARSDKPFLAVNCPAIPTHLFESEFFGHVRGAFTSAHGDRVGLFEAASGGTLFLDEIGDIALENQVKLLRTLQEGEIKRVGGTSVRRVDVRLICATNRDIVKAVEQRQFREDLYYRINVFPVRIPPLRERRGDILPLASHFVERARRELKLKQTKRLAASAMDALIAYDWPGNIRQLENSIRQAMVRAPEQWIESQHLSLEEPLPRLGEMPVDTRITLREAQDRLTRNYLESVLQRVRGNVSRAASLAGKHRTELYELLRRHDIDPEQFRSGVSGQFLGRAPKKAVRDRPLEKEASDSAS